MLKAEQMYKMCLHKRKYRNKEIAEKWRKILSEKYNKEHRVYLCPLCRYYHLSTKVDKENAE